MTSMQIGAASDQALNLDPAFVEKARKLRPFYFIVVVWGERYTDLLLNYCVASLLSPNNIPALLNSGNKFLIATTDEDWARMKDRPIFKLLEQYVEPVFFRIPPCPGDVPQCVHMGIGHKLGTHRAFEDRAYGAIITPDLMMSDGSIAALQRHAVHGIEVVLTAALRFGEEPLFEHLKQLGVVAGDSRLGDEGRPLVVTGRQMVWAGVRSFHSETLRYEWEKPCFHPFPSGVWWRVPDEDGVVVHSLSWSPMLIDYNAVAHHDSTVMDNWTIDGDYIHRNFGASNDKVYVVQDSDEIMQISWAPLSDRKQSLEPTSRLYLNPIFGEWVKGAAFYQSLRSPVFDPLKQKIFPLPVFWHSQAIDREKWNRAEKKAINILTKYCGYRLTPINGAYHAGSLIRMSVFAINWAMSHLIFRFFMVLHYLDRIARYAAYYWTNRRHALVIARQALKGDQDAKMRVKRGLRYLAKILRGLSPV